MYFFVCCSGAGAAPRPSRCGRLQRHSRGRDECRQAGIDDEPITMSPLFCDPFQASSHSMPWPRNRGSSPELARHGGGGCPPDQLLGFHLLLGPSPDGLALCPSHAAANTWGRPGQGVRTLEHRGSAGWALPIARAAVCLVSLPEAPSSAPPRQPILAAPPPCIALPAELPPVALPRPGRRQAPVHQLQEACTPRYAAQPRCPHRSNAMPNCSTGMAE